MPLGVEHGKEWAEIAEDSIVRLPLMPLGVEHILLQLFCFPRLFRAITFDAVRR